MIILSNSHKILKVVVDGEIHYIFKLSGWNTLTHSTGRAWRVR